MDSIKIIGKLEECWSMLEKKESEEECSPYSNITDAKDLVREAIDLIIGNDIHEK